MSDLHDLNRIDELVREITKLQHENTMLKAHLAMFTRRLADPEHEKRSADRRKQAYNVLKERRSGFDRRQMISGLKG